jgi:hypothetical protein
VNDSIIQISRGWLGLSPPCPEQTNDPIAFSIVLVLPLPCPLICAKRGSEICMYVDRGLYSRSLGEIRTGSSGIRGMFLVEWQKKKLPRLYGLYGEFCKSNRQRFSKRWLFPSHWWIH